ncbi:MAG: thioredoxin family protein [Micrococcus sp.]|nr:thioredoxin family protein [Micrococcus sp.]
MRIELLHIDGCPNSVEAGRRVDAALAALGHRDAAVHMRLLESSADAVGTAFAGSPTIMVGGVDIFPNGAPTSDLACRIYSTPGGLAGLPTVDHVKDALSNHGL